jgi:hypothetical protein
VCAIGWVGVACVARDKKDSERNKNRKVDGEEEKKKKKDPAKIGVGTKKIGKFGARETRPMSTTKKALRVAL